MANYDKPQSIAIVGRIRAVAESRHISFKGICDELNVRRTYFGECENENARTCLSHERVEKTADILGTTVAYLLGETDQKEKPADLSVNGLSAEQQRIIDLWSAASPEIRAAARAVLETGVPGALAPDAQEAQQ